MKEQRLKILFITLFVITLLFGITSIAQAGFKEPPVPPEHLQGPAMVGNLTSTFTPDPDNLGYGSFTTVITVKGQGVSKTVACTFPNDEAPDPIPYAVFASMNIDDLTDYRLPNCLVYPLLGKGGILIINTILPSTFSNDGSTITGEIVILEVTTHP